MIKKDLYLLTAFVCSACDGEIAPEEIKLIKELNKTENLFDGVDIDSCLKTYVSEINEKGIKFINSFVSDLGNADLSENEQIKVIDVAIKMIEADNKIEYAEVKFFKKLRAALSISDERILEVMPEIEDYLLPDINASEFKFDSDIKFENINFLSLTDKP